MIDDRVILIGASFVVGFLFRAIFGPRAAKPAKPPAGRELLLDAVRQAELLNEAVARLPGRFWLSVGPVGSREVRLCDDLHHRRPRPEPAPQPPKD